MHCMLLRMPSNLEETLQAFASLRQATHITAQGDRCGTSASRKSVSAAQSRRHSPHRYSSALTSSGRPGSPLQNRPKAPVQRDSCMARIILRIPSTPTQPSHAEPKNLTAPKVQITPELNQIERYVSFHFEDSEACLRLGRVCVHMVAELVARDRRVAHKLRAEHACAVWLPS